MFSEQFYDPQSLVRIEDQNKYKNHPELYLKRQIVVQERELIKQLIYMISGLETQIFTKTFDEVQLDQQSNQLVRVFHFALRDDCRIVFTHLTYQSIKSCTQLPIKLANLINFLTAKSKILYSKTSNVLLKSFAQGIIYFVTRLTIQLTKILTELQRQCGNISLQINSDNHLTKYTLLKLSCIFQQKVVFVSEIVNILSKVMPYMNSIPSQSSPTDNYLVIQILFQNFSRLMNSIEFNRQQQSQVILIYRNSLLFYTKLIENWIQMNPHLLQTKKQIPFFIKLSQINFSLSKSSLKQNLNQVKNQSHHIILNDKIQNKNEFIQFFFKLDNLLVEEYLPNLFKRQGSLILQLGKIIQFIYLYYSTNQRPILKEYFSVSKQFQKLYDLIGFCINKNKNNVKNNNFEENTSMFVGSNQIRKRKVISISQRLAKQKTTKMQFIKVTRDNPFQMFATTRGVFIENQNSKKQKNVHPKQITDKKQKQHKSLNLNQNKQDFVIRFQRVLEQIIQKLYQKSLFFFQQQSSKQFFKLTSHLQKNTFQNTISNITQNAFKLFPEAYQLQNLQNNQRIIQSISLTLIGIKKFMLYEQGDFFLQLINLVSNIFQSSYTKISRSNINSYIQEAIKSSSANNLPVNLKQKVSFIFLKKSKDPEIKYFTVWSVFSIVFKPQFPVNCIFTQQIMQSFGQVFNFIFNIKKCEHILKQIWQDYKQNAKITTQYSMFQIKKHPFQSKILAIRNNLHHFINVVFGFVMIQIQSMWDQYIKEINISFSNKIDLGSMKQQMKQQKNSRKIHNPISLIELTCQLQKNLKLHTTQNTILSRVMILISELLGRFKKQINIATDSKEWNEVIFKQEIQYIQHDFAGIMDIAKNIQGIGQSIFYNHQF